MAVKYPLTVLALSEHWQLCDDLAAGKYMFEKHEHQPETVLSGLNHNCVQEPGASDYVDIEKLRTG